MPPHGDWKHEAGKALKFAAVGMLGFATDALVLRAGLALGMEPAWARVISLTCAMHVTFTINGLFVFRCLKRGHLAGPWARYMLSNGFGNLCNYWIFVTLVSSHWPMIAQPLVALAIASATAWVINYAGVRLYAFAEVEKRW